MAMRDAVRLGFLGGACCAAIGCGGGGDTTDGTAQPVRTVRRERSNDVGRLPDPLAAAVDVAPEDQMTPPQLVDALGTPDYPRMVRARDRLVRMGPAALPPLVAGFAHKDAGVRRNAAHACGLLGEPGDDGQVVAGLATLADAPEADVRREALLALGRLRIQGDWSYVEQAGKKAFFHLDDADPGVRSHAAEVIRKLQYRDAVERLIGLLVAAPDQAVDPVVQRHALDALRDITHENFGTDAATWAAWWQANADRLFGA